MNVILWFKDRGNNIMLLLFAILVGSVQTFFIIQNHNDIETNKLETLQNRKEVLKNRENLAKVDSLVRLLIKEDTIGEPWHKTKDED